MAQQDRRAGDPRNWAVPPEKLSMFFDPAELPFETTDEVSPLDGGFGQDRGIAALTFGLEMESPGFNLFVAGPTGTGRMATTKALVEQLAAAQPTPGDWCYVYNFDDPGCPRVIGLPTGWASRLAEDMERLIKAVQRELREAFESQKYREQQEQLHRPVEEQRERRLSEMSARAREEGFALSVTPAGPVAIPLVGERPMTEEEFSHLSPEEQKRRRSQGDRLVAALRAALEEVVKLEREVHRRMAEHQREFARLAVGPLVREYQEKYRDHPNVVEYLKAVQEDIVRHVDEFLREGESEARGDEERRGLVEELERTVREHIFDRYTVNVFVDNRGVKGAPVIAESNPTYYNLVGRVEYRARLGAMTTDFQMIKPGALHRANGGFLMLQALEVLRTPFAWEALKRMLLTRQVRIENLGDQFTAVPVATLRPEPIPLRVKVVLIGPPLVYYLLYYLDEDFRKLFRVRADFDDETTRSTEHIAKYAAFISRQVREQQLLPFHRSAVAKVIEYGAWQVEHQERLSMRLDEIADLVAEASHWAAKEQSRYVMAEHVQRSIDQKTYRSNLIEDKIRQLVAEGTIFIDTTGARAGQVNGLSILRIGDYTFGRPVRITVQTALGTEGVINVERETRLSGRIHNKAFLILTSFLTARYAQDKPLTLTARITFEQTYDEVEGDSASISELYTLLSSLSGLPLRQDIAVTGSVNQLGEVQPVGGVTQKIEGFFAVCRAKGLTGQQGVIIPAANVKHLMLREEVVDAVRRGQFHVWAVRTVDEGIEILTGVPAGRPLPDGRWEDGTVNARVDERLRAYAQQLKTFARLPEHVQVREQAPAEIGPRAPRLPRLRELAGQLLARLRQ